MQTLRKRLVIVSLALTTMVMAAAMLLALPLVAYADPAVIDIGDFVGVGGDVDSASGVDSWDYDDTYKVLTLSEPDGVYTLTGSNMNLRVYIDDDCTVTLDNMTLSSLVGDTTFASVHELGLTIIGANTLAATDASALSVGGYGNCTIGGTGSLAISSTGSNAGLVTIADLTITGSVSVGVLGSPAIAKNSDYPFSILMGDSASLVLTNNSGAAETHEFVANDTGSTYQWKLTGGATLEAGYDLTDDTIEVSFAAGEVGSITRESTTTTTYVCERYDSSDVLQDSYTTLEDALDEANDGDTIVLLVNLGEPSLTSILIGSDFRLTIDMAGYFLHIPNTEIEIGVNGRLSIINGDDLTVDTITVEGSLIVDVTLTTLITGDLNVKGTDASAVVEGSLNALVSTCIEAKDGATVEVSGDVSSVAYGIDAGDSSVQVGGDINAGNTGVAATAGAVVTVGGDINAANSGIAAASSTVQVAGDVVAGGTAGVFATSGSHVTVGGDVLADGCGIDASNSIVEISGDVDAGAFLPAFRSIRATNGSTLFIGGSITTSDMVFIIGSEAEVAGDIKLSGADKGVYVLEGGDLVVGGSISALSLDDGWFALYCDNDSTTWVKGDVNSNKNGVWASDGGEVTIDGKLNTLDLYVMLGDFDSYGEAETQLMATDFTTPTTKDGYLTYTDTTNTVWVFDLSGTPDEPGPGGPGTPGGPKPITPATGDIAGLLLMLSALTLLLGAGLLVRRRWLQQVR